MKNQEKILRERKRVFLFLAGLIIFFCLVSFVWKSLPANAQNESTTTEAVTVRATVQAWIDFDVSTSSLDMTPPLVQADGTLNIGSTPDLDLSVGTNAPLGWQIRIKGQNGGLYSSSATYTIPSVSGTSTLATGTEAYGANATSATSTVTIGSYYNYYGTNPPVVGEIQTSDNVLASKTSKNPKVLVAKMQVKATASPSTPPGNDYQDVITLTAAGLLP